MHHTANHSQSSQTLMPNTHSSEISVMPSSEPWDTTSADPFAPVTAPNAEYIAMVTKLFDHWRIWFGAKVSANTRFGTAWVIEWADYLENQSATVDELRQAYRISKTLDFPPTNARDFLALVRTSRHIDPVIALSIAIEAANALAYNGTANWHTGEIYATARRVGTWSLLNQDHAKLSTHWQRIYADICKASDAGESFFLPPAQAIEYKPQHEPAPADFVVNLLSKIKKSLQGATA